MNEIATQEPRQMQPYLKAIHDAKSSFLEQSFASIVNYDDEKGHAAELLLKNPKAMQAAQEQPAYVRRALTKVASIGLSLNPATAYAYLVPRFDKNIGNHICLDISYKGLVKLATDSGAIKWAKAELVKEHDTFQFKGVASEPVHKMEPFGDRGKLVGVYCVAKTSDGDFLTDVMSLDEIKDVQKTSKAKFGPWNDWFGEMAKKTIIKRARKQWPNGNDNRLETAIDVINEHEGLDKKEQAQPNDYLLTGEIVEPFFEAFFKNDSWLMFEIQQKCSDDQWPMLMSYLSPVGKQITKKKQHIDSLVVEARTMFRDCVAEYKEHLANDDELGCKQLEDDLPDYWKSKLLEVVK